MKDFFKTVLLIECLFLVAAGLHEARAEFTQTGECIRDASNNLTWYVAPGTYTWFDKTVRGTANGGDCAKPGGCDTEQFLKSLSVCALTGWRLPTKAELETLLLCPQGRSVDWVHGYPCTNARTDKLPKKIKGGGVFGVNGSYWTDETYLPLPEYAWFVNFDDGSTNRSFKSDQRGIMAVTADTFVRSASCNLPAVTKVSATRYTIRIPETLAGSFVKSLLMDVMFGNSSNTAIIRGFTQ